MNPKDLIDELVKHYIDADYQVTVDRDPTPWSTGNGLLHTGFAVLVMKRAGLIDKAPTWLDTAFYMAEDPGQPGVFDRNPGRNDKEAHDDYCGIVGASSVFGLRYHKEVLAHGLTHFFVYENVDGKFDGIRDMWAFRLRFPFTILWYFMASGWFMWLGFLLRFYLDKSSSNEDSSSLIRNYCVVASLAEKSEVWAKFERQWLEKNDLVAAVEAYFNKKDRPPHPLSGLTAVLVSSIKR